MNNFYKKAEFLSDVTRDEVREVRFMAGVRECDTECTFTFLADERGMPYDQDEVKLKMHTRDGVIEADVWDAFYSYLYKKPMDGDAFFALDKSWSLREFEDYLDECSEKGLVKISSMGGGAHNSQLFCEVKVGDLNLSLLLKTVTARGYGKMVFFTRSDSCYVAVGSAVSRKSAAIFGVLEDKLELTWVLKNR